MKIIFFGTSDFAAEILKPLIEKFEVLAVVTQPDKAVGRQQVLAASEVSKIAESAGIRILKFSTLKNTEAESEMAGFGADIFVVAAYGKIVPGKILSIPRLGSINVHASLLPKYRGASPIQAAIKNGDTETGVTIMLMDELVDHGPLLAEEAITIDKDDTTPVLSHKLAILGQNLLLRTIISYEQGLIGPIEQDHSAATLTSIIRKEDGKVDWCTDASAIYNLYRAFVSWPGIWTKFNGAVIKINKCACSDYVSSNKPGTVYKQDEKIFVVCAKGSLQLIEVQLAGKKNTDIQSFVRGHKDFIGSVLG
ncbi:methionyl-tRNA formyltransferase [Patescibacteria group bacterium]|nr:methionyl-tRNA formyltransferase [Patescibacteria group bacterium]